MQVAPGIAEHDPRRHLAGGARNGNRGRLPRRQYSLEPRDCRFLARALLGGHHVEAVGLVDVVDQGGEVATELCHVAGHGSYVGRRTVTAPEMESAAAVRRVFISSLAVWAIPVTDVIEAVAASRERQTSICA